jgi:hypothetical protein
VEEDVGIYEGRHAEGFSASQAEDGSTGETTSP